MLTKTLPSMASMASMPSMASMSLTTHLAGTKDIFRVFEHLNDLLTINPLGRLGFLKALTPGRVGLRDGGTTSSGRLAWRQETGKVWMSGLEWNES
jgi:hypothetical protein